jgi:hypothetical protein
VIVVFYYLRIYHRVRYLQCETVISSFIILSIWLCIQNNFLLGTNGWTLEDWLIKNIAEVAFPVRLVIIPMYHCYLPITEFCSNSGNFERTLMSEKWNCSIRLRLHSVRWNILFIYVVVYFQDLVNPITFMFLMCYASLLCWFLYTLHIICVVASYCILDYECSSFLPYRALYCILFGSIHSTLKPVDKEAYG